MIVPKVKIKEPKKEEKKKEMKPEVAKAPAAPPAPTTTVTVTTENKPYLVTDDKGHQVVAYFDQNSVSLPILIKTRAGKLTLPFCANCLR